MAGVTVAINPGVLHFPQSAPAVRPVRHTRQVRAKISHMDNSQLESFLRAAKAYGPRQYAMFLCAVAHGARASEICNLRLIDINFKTEQIHIARLKGSLDSTQTLLRVKGNSLFNEAAALKEWLAVRQPDADNFVFNSQKSTRLSRITVFKLFRAIAGAAGLPEALQHPHVLKHTAAMLMVRAGANAFLIRQHLGHRSFDSTSSLRQPFGWRCFRGRGEGLQRCILVDASCSKQPPRDAWEHLNRRLPSINEKGQRLSIKAGELLELDNIHAAFP